MCGEYSINILAMGNTVKRLGLGALVFRRNGSFAARILCLIFGVGLTIFFRRIELFNHESIPENDALIFVSNHPNALIDPALLFVALPKKIAFLAKSTLFKMPIIGSLIKAVGALPLYRQQDAGEDVSKNHETFRLTRELLKSGGAISLFPEGVSHNSTKLLPLKTGAARIALGAVSTGKHPESLRLSIVPVGLYYTSKTTFRSDALLHFGRSFPVTPVVLDEQGHPPREAVRELNELIASSLRSVTLNAESDAELKVARIAEEVFTGTTPHEESLAERLDFLQRFVGDESIENDGKLEKRLEEYERKLDSLGIDSEFLDLASYSKRFVLKHALLRSWHLILLSPLVIVGIALHFIPYQLSRMIAATQTRKGDHDMTSTMKFISAMVLMPLTWLGIAVAVEIPFGWKIALASVPVSFLAGWVALRALEEIDELRRWLRAIIAFFAKRETFLRLLAERRHLFEKVKR